MNPKRYRRLTEILQNRLGLILGEDKRHLVRERLEPLVAQHGLHSLDDLVAAIDRPRGDEVLDAIVDTLTSRSTHFFSDPRSLDTLFDYVLPRVLEVRGDERPVRIWSAACAAGEEIHSIGIGLRDRFPELSSQEIELLGTDLYEAALRRADRGEYPRTAVEDHVPSESIERYFELDRRTATLRSDVRDSAQFDTLNLLDPFDHVGRQDVIICRDVLRYFDPEVQCDVVDRLTRCLQPEGFLVLGSGEGLAQRPAALRPIPESETPLFQRATERDLQSER
ncbi:MAG: CheR family methyltransferase [Planctomycetota bacterium]